MNRSQWILIGMATVALLGFYLFGKTKAPQKIAKADTHQHDDDEHEHDVFDMNVYLQKVRESIASKDTLAMLTQAEAQFKKFSANTERTSKAEAAMKVASAYLSVGDPLGNAFYFNEAAQLMNKTETWEQSGDKFYSLISRAPAGDVKTYLTDAALNAYSKALEADTANVNFKLKVASCYVEGGTNPMQGIGMLLDIVRKDSTNADAQFMLGKFSMMSGQNEKAINRLEKVLHSQPQNLEAMFLLAEAYRNTGNKERAVKLFEQCRKLIDNEEIKKEIDRYIQETKTN